MAVRARDNSLKPRTHETARQYIAALNHFFAEIRLMDITPGHLKTYQDARRANFLLVSDQVTHPWKKAAGHSLINHEICTLALILKHAKLWAKLDPLYFPLSIPKWSPRDVLTEEDEQDLFSKAASHPEAALAYWVACITNNTSAAGCELRGLKLKHIFLRGKGEISEIYIPPEAVKNEARPRKIALNRTARWAVEQCMARAIQLGSCQPDHYLFPGRSNRDSNPSIGANGKRKKWNPERLPSRWYFRKSWNKLRAVTGFTHLNPHDLRHQCITRLLENGVEPETVRAIAGHVTQQMMEYYSHIRAQAKYAAVMAIELDQTRRKKAGPQPMQRYA